MERVAPRGSHLDVVDGAVPDPRTQRRWDALFACSPTKLCPELGKLWTTRVRSSLNPVAKLAASGVHSTEAALRLGIDGADVYRMLFAGELEGGPGRDGMVYFDEASIDTYVERHGFGVVAGSSTGSSTGPNRSSWDESTPASMQKSRKPGHIHRATPRRTGHHGPLITHNPKVAGSNPAPGRTSLSYPSIAVGNGISLIP